MLAMVAKGHAAGVQMGWYANNCWCNEGKTDASGWPKPYYEGNARAIVGYKFDAVKIDSCGPSSNITAWREALNNAATTAGHGRIQIENCRNYDFTKNITKTSECPADFFRSTEDNAPDFLSIMANLVMNANAPVFLLSSIIFHMTNQHSRCMFLIHGSPSSVPGQTRRMGWAPGLAPQLLELSRHARDHRIWAVPH